jgi:hypothetical protein
MKVMDIGPVVAEKCSCSPKKRFLFSKMFSNCLKVVYKSGKLDNSNRKMLQGWTYFGSNSYHGQKDVLGQID